MSRIIYTAVFVDRLNLPAPSLARRIDVPHITLAFRPEEKDVPWDIFGEIVKVDVTGYANDGRNEGLRVKMNSESERVMKEVSKVAVPHITLSVADGCSAKDSANLDFKDIDEPYSFYGKIGGFTSAGVEF